MSVVVERIPDQPIIVFHYDGFLDIETMQSAFKQSAAIAAGMEGTIYRISDIRTADSNFIEIMNILKISRANTQGTSADPKYQVMFVGQNQLARMYTDALKQLGVPPIPFFNTMEEAMQFIEVEQHKQV